MHFVHWQRRRNLKWLKLFISLSGLFKTCILLLLLLLLLIRMMIIFIFKADNVFSMTANLPYSPPMNTDTDYYQTFSDFFLLLSDVV